MSEIVFGGSAAASLKMAKDYDGRTPIIIEIDQASEGSECQIRNDATSLSGCFGSVYEFNLALSIGDISEELPGEKRRTVLEQLYGLNSKFEGKRFAEQSVKRSNENWAEVSKRFEAGEPVRIWYSSQPDELCGAYWFLSQLHRLDKPCGPVSLVKLPEWEYRNGGGLLRKNSWGETAPEEWRRYLPLQKYAPQVLIGSCASHWKELQKENKPLRAAINGQLVSVPETIYDSFINREIEAEQGEFQESKIIGRVLGAYQLGIGDAWISLRIEEMVRRGELEPVAAELKTPQNGRQLLKKRELYGEKGR